MSLIHKNPTEEYENTIIYLYNELGLEPKIKSRADLKDHTKRELILIHLEHVSNLLVNSCRDLKHQFPETWKRGNYDSTYSH